MNAGDAVAHLRNRPHIHHADSTAELLYLAFDNRSNVLAPCRHGLTSLYLQVAPLAEGHIVVSPISSLQNNQWMTTANGMPARPSPERAAPPAGVSFHP